MLQITNKSSAITYSSKRILSHIEDIKLSKITKKQEASLAMIINLINAVKEDSEFINERAFNLASRAIEEK